MKLHSLDHPLYWYKYNVSGSIEILDAYISDVEQQVDKSAADFKANSEEVVIEGVYEDELPTCITLHKGLNDSSWDLNAIFFEEWQQQRRWIMRPWAFNLSSGPRSR